MTHLELLDPATTMGAVTLFVSDLDAMVAFYRDGVGLRVLPEPGTAVVLGLASGPVVILEPAPSLSSAALGSAGLYHTAILFESPGALAAAVLSTARQGGGQFVGSSDHAVSEAFYFSDPEGNGVELYTDRDRSTWVWANGAVAMTTTYLDPNRYIEQHLREPADSSTATVGHVHLSVGDISRAREFYVDRLGFEQTATFGDQALFVSAGGYHHHMGMNTWNSRGAGPRTRALGLGSVDIRVPSADDLGALEERMLRYRVAVRNDGVALTFTDPWDNVVRVTSGA